MTRFASILLLAAAVAPFAFAHDTGSNPPSNPPSNQCGESEFFFETKSCCLPHGGTPNPPAPPKGVYCPVSGWYWHTGKQCCVPHEPPKPSGPPPQCPKDCAWSSLDLKCYPGPPPSKPTPPPSKPSSKPGEYHWRRRDMKSRSLCPSGLVACPIGTIPGRNFECVDPASDLNNCGGCASTNAGQDCTLIEGVASVGCAQGSCEVFSCQQGFRRSSDGKSCIRL